MISIQLTAEQLQRPGVAESLSTLMRALGSDEPAAPKAQAAPAASAKGPKKAPTAKATAKAAPKAPKKSPKKAKKPAANAEVIKDLEGLMNAVSENSRKFLEILQNRKQLTMKEAMVALGLEEKKAVGGVVGGVSRKAQKHGLYPPYRTGKTDAGDRLWKWTGDVENEPKALPTKKKKRGRPKGKKSSRAKKK